MTYHDALAAAAVAYLTGLMARHDGNISAASVEAEIDPESLRRLLKRYGLRPVRVWTQAPSAAAPKAVIPRRTLRVVSQ